MFEILAMGLDEDGVPVHSPIHEPLEYIREEAKQSEDRLLGQINRARSGREIEGPLDIDAYPEHAKWTILVNEKDPDLDLYKEIFTPLAKRRKLIDNGQTLDDVWMIIDDESVRNQDWGNWIRYTYIGRKRRRERPRYVLILGDVDQIPLGLQIDLSLRDFVGRLAFDDPEDYRRYAAKLDRLERQGEGVTNGEALFLATKHAGLENKPDASHYSCEYFVPELIRCVHDRGAGYHAVLNHQATKENFIRAIQNHRPSVVFTASHGQPPRGHKGLEYNMRYGGAIQFPASAPGQSYLDKIFSADDVDNFPREQSLFEGSIFFQFACFGYGTPAVSDYSIWDKKYPFPLCGQEYISAMPRRLLAHPRGPVAYIGHLDQALVKSIVSRELYRQNKSDIDPRIMPFEASLETLLSTDPVAYAMQGMKEDYLHNLHMQVADTIRQKRNGNDAGSDMLTQSRFVDEWLTLTDAKNYLVFGDPAVCMQKSGSGF